MPPIQISNPSNAAGIAQIQAMTQGTAASDRSTPAARPTQIAGQTLPSSPAQARAEGAQKLTTGEATLRGLKSAALVSAAVVRTIVAVGTLGLSEAIPAALIKLAENYGTKEPKGSISINLPGGQTLQLKGAALPRRIPENMTMPQLQAALQAKVTAGADLVQQLQLGLHDGAQRCTQEDATNIAHFFQALGQQQKGEFRSGAFNIEDPGQRIRQFLDTCPVSYQRESSHVGKFQSDAGGRHRGLDCEGSGSKLGEFLPNNNKTILYGTMKGHDLPNERLFFKMESHGAFLSRPKGGGDADGPSRSGNWHDVGALVGHGVSYVLTRGKGSAPGTFKERLPDSVKNEFKAFTKSVGEPAKSMLLANNPTGKEAGIRVIISNARDVIALYEAAGIVGTTVPEKAGKLLNTRTDGRDLARDLRADLDRFQPDAPGLEHVQALTQGGTAPAAGSTKIEALRTLVAKLEANYGDTQVRIGNEVVLGAKQTSPLIAAGPGYAESQIHAQNAAGNVQSAIGQAIRETADAAAAVRMEQRTALEKQDFAATLGSPAMRAAFREMLVSEHSTENLDCYEAIESFNQGIEQSNDLPKLQALLGKATEIFTTWIAAGSVNQVNLPSTGYGGRNEVTEKLNAITAALGNQPVNIEAAKDSFATLFKSTGRSSSPESQLVSLMNRDSFKRFTTSPIRQTAIEQILNEAAAKASENAASSARMNAVREVAASSPVLPSKPAHQAAFQANLEVMLGKTFVEAKAGDQNLGMDHDMVKDLSRSNYTFVPAPAAGPLPLLDIKQFVAADSAGRDQMHAAAADSLRTLAGGDTASQLVVVKAVSLTAHQGMWQPLQVLLTNPATTPLMFPNGASANNPQAVPQSERTAYELSGDGNGGVNVRASTSVMYNKAFDSNMSLIDVDPDQSYLRAETTFNVSSAGVVTVTSPLRIQANIMPA